MTRLIRLWDEKDLIICLKSDALILIHASTAIPPVKKLVEATDILDLTLLLNERFPTEPPDLPVGDECALMRLREISFELYVYHRLELPVDHVVMWDNKIKTLLAIYRLPKENFDRSKR